MKGPGDDPHCSIRRCTSSCRTTPRAQDETGEQARRQRRKSSPSASRHLHEFNPMLGFRGCRLGIVYPEITAMQARAIFEAACNVQKAGIEVQPEIMIPLVGFLPELKAQAKIVHGRGREGVRREGREGRYLVGTMIELPRACVAADQIAKEAAVLQLRHQRPDADGLGMSRDDYGSFIRHYMENDLVPRDPVPDDRLRRRRRADEDRRGARVATRRRT